MIHLRYILGRQKVCTSASPRGSGKTFTVTETLINLELRREAGKFPPFRCLHVNCFSTKRTLVYFLLHRAITPKLSAVRPLHPQKELLFGRTHPLPQIRRDQLAACFSTGFPLPEIFPSTFSTRACSPFMRRGYLLHRTTLTSLYKYCRKSWLNGILN